MSDQLKYIVENLNRTPFSKNFNLISFDSLQPIQLLQVLNDVFAEISSQQSFNVHEEDPEQRILRMFGFLKVLLYKPKADPASVSEFRQGLVQGDKPVIYPMLQWLLERLPELKKRAYLGHFLVKLEIPHDLLLDPEVAATNQMYMELIGQFKESHKTVDKLRVSGYSIAEIKRDIGAMEEEHDQLKRRIERMQKRIDTVAEKEKLLSSAKQLRMEKEKDGVLNEQRSSQKSQLSHCDQRIQRLLSSLREAKASSVGITSDGLIKKLQEENQVNTFLCQDKIPKEVLQKENFLGSLQKVVHDPSLGQREVDELSAKAATLSGGINSLVEKRMVNSDPMEDKLSVFRQQAAVIANKKSSAAENLQEAMEELSLAEDELDAKRQENQGSEDGSVLKGEEFKRYVNKLRTKSTLYKKKRAKVAELKAELGILQRTEEILTSKYKQLQLFVQHVESDQGVSGFHETQENLEMVSTIKSDFDEKKGKTLEDISQMVVQMNNSVAERKNSLAPIINELRPMRIKAQELSEDHRDKKRAYETTAAGLESNLSKLEQEVKGYREQSQSEESRLCYLMSVMKIFQAQERKASNELKLYKSADASQKKKSYREMYSQRIHEQELLGKALREKQKHVRDTHTDNVRQMKMWSDLSELLLLKRQVLHQDQESKASSERAAFEEQDHLVL